MKEGRYPLLNNRDEQDRLDLQHHLFLLTQNQKLLNCPAEPAKLHRVLDLGTGTGIWVMDFGDHSSILGVDLSPIKHDRVPPNVRFCADDIEAMVILSLCSCVWRSTSNDYFRGSKDDAFQVLMDIASALEYLYSLELGHNDIKPSNILLSKERGAVLSDFGLLRRIVLGVMSGGTA